MKLSVALDVVAPGIPILTRWRQVQSVAHEADRLGYSGIWLGEYYSQDGDTLHAPATRESLI